MRDAVFYIITHYPREVPALELYEKPAMLLATAKSVLAIDFATLDYRVVGLVFLQLLLFFAFIIGSALLRMPMTGDQAGIVPLLLGFSIFPLFLHYSSLSKAGDCIVLMFATLIIACGWVAQWTLQIVCSLAVGTALAADGSPLIRPPHQAAARCPATSVRFWKRPLGRNGGNTSSTSQHDHKKRLGQGHWPQRRSGNVPKSAGYKGIFFVTLEAP
jgi:hypothetical protein